MTNQAPPPQHVNLFFRLAVLLGGAFVVTILAFTATLFGDSRSPLASLFERHAGSIFLAEVTALVALGVAAMAVDRRESLRHSRSHAAAAACPSGETAETAIPRAAAQPDTSQGGPP